MDSVIGQLAIQSGNALTPTAILRGATSQTANLQEWQNDAGTIQARVTSGGSIVTTQGFAVLGGASISGTIATLLQSASAARIPVVVQGAASQSANLTEWQNSAGTVLANVNSAGLLNMTRALILTQTNAGEVGIRVRGAVSQTGNLQEWQNSGATVLASVLAGGNIVATDFRTTNTHGLLGEENSGGRLRMVRQTAANSSPGANVGTLYFRDGTNAGTLKLVVRAGAAGAETTILDNIPQ
jgi:hypothetical protein